MYLLTDFEKLACKAPYQFFRYAMDWHEQNALCAFASRDWEKREPGSIHGVLNAYAYVIPLIRTNKTIDVDDVRMIHRKCSEPLAHCRDTAGIFRKHLISFGVTVDTISEQGLRALVESSQDLKAFRSHIDKNISTEKRYEHLWHRLQHDGALNFFGYDGALTADEIDLVMKEDASDVSLVLQEKLVGAIFDKIETILRQFNSHMRHAHARDKKLAVIAETIQRLERAHPFYDCNCRTFCMVLLNTWLMQYGFRPVLLDNPNRFDGYAVHELVALINEGMNKTRQLMRFVDKQHKSPKSYQSIGRLDITHWCEVHPIDRDPLNAYAHLLQTVCLQQPRTSHHFFQEVDDSVDSTVLPNWNKKNGTA